jgi:tRNA (guanine9-N1)-methyltransferase
VSRPPPKDDDKVEKKNKEFTKVTRLRQLLTRSTAFELPRNPHTPIGRMELDTEEVKPAATPLDQTTEDSKTATDSPATTTDAQPPLTKSALKKLKRRQQWDEGREERKRIRKERRVERKARQRIAREEKIAAAEAAGIDRATALEALRKPQGPPATIIPIALLIDCDFEKYMLDKEIISLASQVTRSYSDNRRAVYQPHMLVSGWGGKLRNRFETALGNSHAKWRVQFVEGGFIDAHKKAKEILEGPQAGAVIDVLKSTGDDSANASLPIPDPEDDVTDPSIVYLTSDSPNTLSRLEPNTTYVIGGLVDRNREKGICYRRARENHVRTAKLPIGEYLSMQSRQVLATNHVVEIILKWLECGDWGEAFLKVIPKRKGGVLKGEKEGSTNGNEGDSSDGEGDTDEDEDKKVEDKKVEDGTVENDSQAS